jgi:hypothetical protein
MNGAPRRHFGGSGRSIGHRAGVLFQTHQQQFFSETPDDEIATAQVVGEARATNASASRLFRASERAWLAELVRARMNGASLIEDLTMDESRLLALVSACLRSVDVL